MNHIIDSMGLRQYGAWTPISKYTLTLLAHLLPSRSRTFAVTLIQNSEPLFKLTLTPILSLFGYNLHSYLKYSQLLFRRNPRCPKKP